MVNVYSDANGLASFLVSPGTYTIKVSKAGYQPVQTTVSVTKDTTITITLTPIQYTLTVKVIDASTGQPISGATVEVV